MNILYISNLTGNLFAGPNNSVPAQIRAQSRLDLVFWYNLNHVKRPEWSVDGLDCKNLDDYPSQRLADLPPPFDHPDVAVVEELYCFPFSPLIKDLQHAGVPYIIIPRSAMTEKAQKKKVLKKRIGNLIYFNRMIRRAAAVQYLTEEERRESDPRWKKKCFVIPNGIPRQELGREGFLSEGIRATYIGRFESYQKGLDLLMQAIGNEQNALRAHGFRLSMYGPDQENSVAGLRAQIAEQGIEDLVSLQGAVFGEDKRRVLLQTDVFVMTSRFEGHPMGLIEALSYGLPCVATLGTNLSTEVAEYDAGWAADNTMESVCDAFRRMLKETSAFAEKGKNAVRLADVYAWERIAEESHKAYLDVITEEKK